MQRVVPVLLAGLLCGSCVYDITAPGVRLSSVPAGARIYVDGADSGFVTPCSMALDEDDRHVVEFELAGYERARRELGTGTRYEFVYRRDADRYPRHFVSRIFLPFEGLFFPIKLDDNCKPSRVHVRMRLADAR